VLGALDVLTLEAPVDTVYGELKALALGHTVVTDNEREFSRIDDLRAENWLR
jgi:tRNA(fMet)-specific endonuclease VapC